MNGINETSRDFAEVGAGKITFLRKNPAGFIISTMMAGAYVGIGILLIMTLGNDVAPESAKLVMGCLFGIALTLVIFAGAELFSGHSMFMAFGFLYRKLTAVQVVGDWVLCWSGNLLGAMLLSVLFVLGGGGGWVDDPTAIIHDVAAAKASGGPVELLARAIICNWLVCLAIWMSARTKSDTARCILIFWCLFAFVAAGFEHGVANMTVFTASLMGAHADSVTVASAWYNLIIVSVGNVIGGAGGIGVAYFLAGGAHQKAG